MATQTRKSKSRSTRGRIYKRKHGKDYPVSDPVKKAVYYLEYKLDGKTRKVRLLDSDGNPCKTIRNAEAARDSLLAPLAAKDKVQRAQASYAFLQAATAEQSTIEQLSKPELPLDKAWKEWNTARTKKPGPSGKLLKPGDEQLGRTRGWWSKFQLWLSENEPNVKYLSEVTTDHANAFLDHLNEQRTSPGSYNKQLGFLKGLFHILSERAKIETNPFAGTFRLEDHPDSRRVLTVDELSRILKEASDEYRPLYMLGLFTGLRFGDCCTLKWAEVDLDKNIINRIPSKTAKRGKKSVRVGIPPVLSLELISIKRRAGKQTYVFPEFAKRYQQYDGPRQDLSREIQRHFISCGIQVHKEGTGRMNGENDRAVVEVGFHSLRHTYVSLHVEAGTPLALIQKNVGHSNPAMTDHYTHVSEEQAVKMANAFPSLIEGTIRKYIMPKEIIDSLEKMNEENWKAIRDQLLKGAA